MTAIEKIAFPAPSAYNFVRNSKKEHKMLEAKHGMYDGFECDLKLDGSYALQEVLYRLNLA